MTTSGGGHLVGLITRIRVHHHVATRNLLEDIRRALDRIVSRARADDRPTMLVLRGAFTAFQDDLLAHLLHEERVVFPYVIRLEEALDERLPAPHALFTSLTSPIAVLQEEQEGTRAALERLDAAIVAARSANDDPALWDALEEHVGVLGRELAVHVSLEQDVLFPTALEAERQLAARGRPAGTRGDVPR